MLTQDSFRMLDITQNYLGTTLKIKSNAFVKLTPDFTNYLSTLFLLHISLQDEHQVEPSLGLFLNGEHLQ